MSRHGLADPALTFLIRRCLEAGVQSDYGDEFGFGLDLILDGLEKAREAT